MIPDYISINYPVQLSLETFLNKNRYSKIGVLADENTIELCYPKVKNALPAHTTFTISSGENHKNMDTSKEIWKWLSAQHFDRSSLLINLGGGVICDMGGFCAATFKRGIDFIHIPTTLLAMADASVGGKLGIDLGPYKNQIGVFRVPDKVIIDPVFLETLPDNQRISGFAEVIKHGLIYDAAYFEVHENIADLTNTDWKTLIYRSIEIKNEIVEEDPVEKGLRKILNFGHTIGHALEGNFLQQNNTEMLHGEAVAIGMICESWLSVRNLAMPEANHHRIVAIILKYFGNKDLKQINESTFVEMLMQDKKNVDNKIRFTLLKDIGKAVYDVEIDRTGAIEALDYYRNLKT